LFITKDSTLKCSWKYKASQHNHVTILLHCIAYRWLLFPWEQLRYPTVPSCLRISVCS
jgi:hypothetical protein